MPLSSPPVEHGTVFVVMPFTADHSDHLRKLIRKVCTKHKLLPIWGDDPLRSLPIIDAVKNALLHSEIIIVDITDTNANVMYELGIAHANRGYDPVVLLCREPGDLPFNISGIRHIFFDLPKNREVFARRLGQYLEDIKLLSKPHVQESFADRTERIVDELAQLCELPNAELRKQTVRFSGSTSAFAFGPNEGSGTGCHKRLGQERDVLVRLARRGCPIRCIITPPGPYAFIPDGRLRAVQRVTQLLTFFESAEEVLNHIEWAVSRYFQRNLYIIGNRCCFEGYKTEAAEGFDMTLCHTAHEAVTAHINFYDSLFSKLAVRTLKDAYPGQQMRLGTRRASVALREVTKKSLAESLKFLKRHRDV